MRECVCVYVSIRRRGKRETFSTLQLRVVGVNMVTFCLYRLSQSLSTAPLSIYHPDRNYFITLKICLTIFSSSKESKDGYAYSNLNFICVELSLDGSESSQLSKLGKKKKRKGDR